MAADALLSTTEAARRLGLSPAQVRLLIRQQRLPARRLGERVWLLEPEDVARYQRVPVGRPKGKRGG